MLAFNFFKRSERHRVTLLFNRIDAAIVKQRHRLIDILNVFAFAIIYRFLPKVPVRWGAAVAGAILASALWEAGRQILAAYVVGEKLPSAYGLIGSFMAIMLWTYYAMLVVLFGAAYTRAANEEGEKRPS